MLLTSSSTSGLSQYPGGLRLDLRPSTCTSQEHLCHEWACPDMGCSLMKINAHVRQIAHVEQSMSAGMRRCACCASSLLLQRSIPALVEAD